MTEQIRTLLTDIARVLIVADATANLPLQNDLLRVGQHHLTAAHKQLSDYVEQHEDDLHSLPPLEEVGAATRGPTPPCSPPHSPLAVPKVYSYSTGDGAAASVTSARSKNLYTEFLSRVQPVAKNIKLVSELWQRHKGLKELDEIVTRALTDLTEMRRQEREEQQGLRTVALG
jgi:hypothetical protein